jgi:Fe-S cluster biogenesis protein NfuA
MIASLLIVHGLHPDDVRSRIERSLAGVRPFLAQHGGDVQLLDIDADAGAVLLQLLGSCDGCPSSAVTLQSAVERAIREAAPEIVIIDVVPPTEPAAASTTPQPAIPVALVAKPSYGACRRRWSRERAVGGPAAHPRIATARAAAGGRVLRVVHGIDRREPRASRRSRGPQPHVHLPRLLLVFTSEGAGGRRYRAVPDRYLAFTDFQLSPAQWDGLQIPVSVAFFFLNSSLERVAAFYPGPAGATESLLPLGTWDEVVDANPALATLAPDVEAFLVRADRATGGAECFLVPIGRVLRARRPPPSPVEGLRRGARGERRRRRLLRACAGEGAMTKPDARGDRRPPGAARGGADDDAAG